MRIREVKFRMIEVIVPKLPATRRSLPSLTGSNDFRFVYYYMNREDDVERSD